MSVSGATMLETDPRVSHGAIFGGCARAWAVMRQQRPFKIARAIFQKSRASTAPANTNKDNPNAGKFPGEHGNGKHQGERGDTKGGR